MCGRYTQTANLESLTSRFGLTDTSEMFGLRYNLAPGQQAPVLIKDAFLTASLMQWGLVPSWARNPSIGYKLINARAETLQEKPSFKKSLVDRRCLVLADGFYEWRKSAGGNQPYLIRLNKGAPFGFAGLWDCWRGSDGHVLKTFTILTTVANALVEPIHKRMPVILDRQQRDAWLLPWAGPEGIRQFCDPFPALAMETIPVSDYVNNPAHDSVKCVQAVPLPDRQTLF